MIKTKTRKHNASCPEQLRQLGHIDEAERRARTLLDADPLHIGALETLAKIQWHAGDFAGLQPTLDRLIGLNPYEPGYHALRGAVLQALGRCGEAVVAYARCTGDGPESVQAREQISDLQDWERYLVSDLLEQDPVFKAEYAHNPGEACRARGFVFVEEPAEPWLPTASVVSVWARPS